jgi:hypothetical protein
MYLLRVGIYGMLIQRELAGPSLTKGIDGPHVGDYRIGNRSSQALLLPGRSAPTFVVL